MQLCGSRPGQVKNPMTNATEEIDECALMPQMCSHGVCINTAGSFHCICDPGYIYDEFAHQCIGTYATELSLTLESRIFAYTSAYANVDENECLRVPNPCRGNAQCVNSLGSYECQCPKGYKLGLNMNDCVGKKLGFFYFYTAHTLCNRSLIVPLL